jgi:MFS family permease
MILIVLIGARCAMVRWCQRINSQTARDDKKPGRSRVRTSQNRFGQGLVPVGNGHAAWGLSAVFVGRTAAAAGAATGAFAAGFFAAFFAAGFLAAAFFAGAFFAAAFFAGAFFFAAAFFAGAFFAGAFFFAAAFFAGAFFFVAAFFAGAFFAAAFFAGAFLAGALFTAAFLTAGLLAAAFLAGAFFAADFLAVAFFAVAITFLLDQVEKKLPCIDVLSTPGSYSSPEVCPGGAPQYDESGCGPSAPLLRRRISLHES